MNEKEKRSVNMCVGKRQIVLIRGSFVRCSKMCTWLRRMEGGKGLVLGESCNKGDFIIEYFSSAVSATKLKKHGGI